MYISTHVGTALRADGRRHSSDTATRPLCARLAACHPSKKVQTRPAASRRQRVPSEDGALGVQPFGGHAPEERIRSLWEAKRLPANLLDSANMADKPRLPLGNCAHCSSSPTSSEVPRACPVLSEDFKSPQLRCSMLAARCNHPGAFKPTNTQASPDAN